ncbi:MAG: hypothetical protein AAB336_12705 [Acidobacteriota bacterium]
MKKIILTIAFALAVGLVGINFDGNQGVVKANSIEPSPMFLGDACRNVKFAFKNKHSENGQITLTKVSYYNRANGRWQTEQVTNAVVNQNASYTTSGDNLSDSEGEDITKVKFHYKWKSNVGGARWSTEVVSSVFEPASPQCVANRTYGGSQWEIR